METMEKDFVKIMNHHMSKSGICFFTLLSEKENEYSLRALRDEDLTEMGYLLFKLEGEQEYSTYQPTPVSPKRVTKKEEKLTNCWIRVVRVHEPFLACGVGKAMLTDFENFVIQQEVELIEAKFYPKGPGADRAFRFYEDNYYSVIDNHEIVKYLYPAHYICNQKPKKASRESADNKNNQSENNASQM